MRRDEAVPRALSAGPSDSRCSTPATRRLIAAADRERATEPSLAIAARPDLRSAGGVVPAESPPEEELPCPFIASPVWLIGYAETHGRSATSVRATVGGTGDIAETATLPGSVARRGPPGHARFLSSASTTNNRDELRQPPENAEHLQHVNVAQIAAVGPDFGAVGGSSQLRAIVGALLTYGLIVSVLMVVILRRDLGDLAPPRGSDVVSDEQLDFDLEGMIPGDAVRAVTAGRGSVALHEGRTAQRQIWTQAFLGKGLAE